MGNSIITITLIYNEKKYGVVENVPLNIFNSIKSHCNHVIYCHYF